ncbi:autotransporter outer membrane beta-barrel domain-containing protein [Pseudomonas sp. SB113]|uniref:autotransporter outer membrane beta-barrel domain-containing protein n=1 Tax=Pseudomonas TaxID=286 RepID=UPI0028E35CB0|nr:autotransporter outer membrane beta-barrel domain-containing protein [Pseudomonas grimontii]
MSINSIFKLKPLAAFFHLPSFVTLLLLAPHVQAKLVENATENVGHADLVDDYQLVNATLNVVEGATRDVYAHNSNVNMSNGSEVFGAVHAQGGSKVTVDDSRIIASDNALTLLSSSALVTDSVLSSAAGIGLLVSRYSTDTAGSTATVIGSSIVGEMGAAAVTGNSLLQLDRSLLLGTGANSYGLRMQSATTIAHQSTITGGRNGIELSVDRTEPGTNTLVLDQTRVHGQTGSALLVQANNGLAATADIEVRNGSTLIGGNGSLLEVTGGSNANMNVLNSQLEGNVIVEAGSTAHLKLNNFASLTGRLDNVSSLEVGANSFWNLTGNSQVGGLSLADGVVKFGDDAAFYQLDLESLSGQGTFVMGTDFATGRTDFLNISGNATGTHALLIASSGAEPSDPSNVRIVHTGGGDAQFSLVGDVVDVGAWSYGLAQVGNDWYLDPNQRTVSPGTRSVLALFNAAPTVWYGEMASLRSRMGELRYNGGETGGWIRSYGNKYEVAGTAGGGYTQTQRGFSLGADAQVGDSPWLVGVIAGHSDSDLDLDRGTSGNIKSYYGGLYATWLDEESGYYFDGVAKVNRLNNNSTVGLSDGTKAKGSYSTNALGVSAEVGKHIKLDDEFFIEPFAQASVVAVQGKSYTLDNQMKAKGGHANSVLGKLGVTAGRDFVMDDGSVVQPYLRAAAAHEFAKSNKVSVNNHTFNNDLSGSRAEFGAGVAVTMSSNLQLHGDFDYGLGKSVDQPWGVNVGVRYTW